MTGPFAITDDSQAAWAMRRRAQRASEQARIKARRDEELARIKAWAAFAIAGLERDIEFFDGLLCESHRARIGLPEVGVPDRLAWGSVSKTHRLPYGTVQARRTDEATVVDDEEALALWLVRTHPDLLSRLMKLTPQVSEVRKVIGQQGGRWVWTDTGEIIDPPPPGLGVREARITISVSTDDVELPVFDPAPPGCEIPDGIIEPEVEA